MQVESVGTHGSQSSQIFFVILRLSRLGGSCKACYPLSTLLAMRLPCNSCIRLYSRIYPLEYGLELGIYVCRCSAVAMSKTAGLVMRTDDFGVLPEVYLKYSCSLCCPVSSLGLPMSSCYYRVHLGMRPPLPCPLVVTQSGSCSIVLYYRACQANNALGNIALPLVRSARREG